MTPSLQLRVLRPILKPPMLDLVPHHELLPLYCPFGEPAFGHLHGRLMLIAPAAPFGVFMAAPDA